MHGERRVIAVIGDGSMTGGMAFEGLNNLGHSGRKAIIVLNDNGRSYAPTVSKLGESVARLRVNPAYLRQRARVDRMLHEMPVVGDRMERGCKRPTRPCASCSSRARSSRTSACATPARSTATTSRAREALRNAAEFDGPIVVHVLTQKGRGYAPAENDPIKRLHDIGAAQRRSRGRTPRRSPRR